MFFEDRAGTTSNGGTTLHCASGRVYKRVYSGPVDARWFGLVEAASNPAAEGAQNSTAMTAALASLRAGEELLVPSGRFVFARPIELPSSRPVRFTAVGTLIFPNSNGVVLRAERNVVDVDKIEGVTGDNTPDNGFSAILFQDSHHNDTRIGAINGFNYGIRLDGKAQYNKINFSRIDTNVGIHFSASQAGDWINENTFHGGAIYGNVGIEAKQSTASGWDSFNGNKFFGIGFEDVQVAIDVTNFQRNLIIGPRFEKDAYGHMNFGEGSQMNTILVGGIYEDHFASRGIRGNAGPLTTVLGSLMTKHSDQSGAIGMADASGKLLGVLNKNGNNAPNVTVINMLPLANVPAVIPKLP